MKMKWSADLKVICSQQWIGKSIKDLKKFKINNGINLL